MGNPEHTQEEADPEASVPWLEDEHVTLLDDGGSQRTAAESERPKRHDDTQRIWCPPGTA